MISYDLAKELKEAGFPQAGRACDDDPWVCCEHRYYHDDGDLNDNPYLPTLSELIEACGDGFRSLTYHSLRTSDPRCTRKYIAQSGARTGKFLKNGKTPEEAVAKLWLRLND